MGDFREIYKRPLDFDELGSYAAWLERKLEDGTEGQAAKERKEEAEGIREEKESVN